MTRDFFRRLSVSLLFSLSFVTLSAREPGTSRWKIVKNGSFYFSWGYNKEWYSHSSLHVKQAALGNDYTLVSVKAHDHPGWNEGLFSKDLTIPQYNYRLGYFFNEKQDMAFEINFDHTKYIIADGQDVRIKGKLNNENIDGRLRFSEANGFSYFLNNGANFLLFNLVKRFDVYHTLNNRFRLDILCKGGIGPVIPHVQNTLFGKSNKQHFQLGGWNAGIETAVRATMMKYVYLEFAQKGDYARYSGLGIYEGTARQSFKTYELILSLGITFPTGKHNNQFEKVKKAI